MCEVVVFTENWTSPDIYMDVKQFKRGDVIVAVPDGWLWSETELSTPRFRIFRFAGVPVSAAGPLLEEEKSTTPVPPGQENKMLQIRGFYLNLEALALQAVASDFINDNTRAVSVFEVPPVLTLDELKVQRPPREDPNVLGDPAIIG